jgi:type I restriction enzyme S subunit
MTNSPVAVIENGDSEAVVQGWRRTRLGYEVWLRARLGWKGLKADEYVPEGYALLSTPDIKGRQINFSNVNYIAKARFDESPEIKISLGDVLLAKDGSTLGTVNVVRALPIEATVNSSIAVLTPYSGLNSEFLSYSLQGTVLKSLIQELKGGMGVPHLFQDDIKMFPLLLPSLKEQSAIASFLDRETAQIDALIDKQQQLIETLAERRKAVITRAVTRGLDPTVPLKDSGFEWLGEIPAHWGVGALKHLADVTLGKMVSSEGLSGDEVQATYLRAAHVQPLGVLWLGDLKTMPFSRRELLKMTLKSGDVVVVEGGAGFGRSALLEADLEGWGFQNSINRVRARGHNSGAFLNWSLLAAQASGLYETMINTATIPHLTAEKLAAVPVTLPSAAEQLEIAQYLSHVSQTIDALATKASSMIEVLKERRQALISAAVTGKIDVRGEGL